MIPASQEVLLSPFAPGTDSRNSQMSLARPEEMPRLTAKRPAQLSQGSESHVLVCALQPVKRGTADSERPRHLCLCESRLSP